MRLKTLLKVGLITAGAASVRKWLTEHPREGAFESRGNPLAEPESEVKERRAEPDPDALAASAEPRSRIGLDLDRLKSMQSSTYKPLVEYLSYIQVQRGEDRSLVFVRQRDLQSLAALTGEDTESFVEEFKQLGVLLSMN